MLKVHKIKLDPNIDQRKYFAKACGVARVAYNWALSEWEKQYKDGGKPSEMVLRKKLNSIKATEFPWMTEVTKNAPQQAIKNLGTAYTNAFRRMKQGQKTGSETNPYGFPRPKRKFINDSFRADNGPQKKGADAVSIQGKKIKLPKIGWVRMREYLRFTGQIKSVTISRQADKWFAAISIETEDILHQRKAKKSCGIDLGVKHLATLSDGTKIEGAKSLEALLKKKKRLQRELCRRKKGSENRSKTKLKLAKLEAQISNARNDAHHKATTEIVLNNHTIAMEDLNVKGMVKNHKLARRLNDQAFGEFKRLIEYKADWYGSRVTQVDRFFPSSKTCNACGHIKEDLKLSDRIFVCPVCDYKEDRDVNAAKNIKDNAVAA
ncbi:RNA-guided endonuclease TnpB family protein [uncultured Desulfobacter sp.]|uniref:RNA-guided endonuclease InsQ/TnpB family protein n=1 Tax=uncultured Desulfobacter sp. TaxID=240139 RepID=UPI0029C6D015|nr:RNA-guided endonuclease TnpB family protein [uncultured Desulfobacter sp.]